MNQNRDKKFVGGLVAGLLSLIGAGVSAGIGAGNARKQRAAQEEALREQQREQNEMDNLQRAQELSNKYANQDLDYMYDRISYNGNTPGTITAVNGQVKQNMYKNGGINKVSYATLPVKRCGGRKKAAYGYISGYNPYNGYDRYGYGNAMKEVGTPQQTTTNNGWTQADTNAAVGGALSTVGSILNSAVNARQNYLNTIQSLKRVKRGTPFSLRRRTPQDEEYTY